MTHGISDVGRGGYFHHVDDNTQIKTAQRSTFQATAGNKISNWFTKKNDANAQRIGSGLKSLRQADLSTRKTLSAASSGLQRFRAKFGAGIDRIKARGDEDALADIADRRQQKLDRIDDSAELKRARLEWKERINQAAPEDMDDTIAQADKEFQELLENKDYEKLEGLSGIAPQKKEPTYMVNADGHRVRTSDQKVPFVARKVAEMGSRQYENGVTGVELAVKRGAQYGAIGLSSGVQLVKQGAYTVAAKMSSHESEERDNFLRHAGRARDMRRLNSASLKGTKALSDKFGKVNKEQEETRAEMFARAGYEDAGGREDGVAPPKTRYSARKMNEYFGDPEDKKPKMRKVASAYVGFANLGSKMSRSYHTTMAKWASKRKDAAENEATQRSINYHGRKAFNANFKIETSLAALDGRLRPVMQGEPLHVEPESEPELVDQETQYANSRSPSPMLPPRSVSPDTQARFQNRDRDRETRYTNSASPSLVSPSPIDLRPSARVSFLDESTDIPFFTPSSTPTPTPASLRQRTDNQRREEDDDDDLYA